MPFGLTDDQWRRLLRGLARGQYNLLLGAGASAEALNETGTKLPIGSELTNRLISHFHLPPAHNMTLRRAYEAALRRGTEDGSFATFLNREFLHSVPPGWYRDLTTLRWKQIWTFNIDDVVEAAFAKWHVDRTQVLIPKHWLESFTERDQTANELFAIHLHGSVPVRPGTNGVTPPVVFSIVEYLDAIEAGHAWHYLFGDAYRSEPFLVLGASLVEEMDFARVLRRGNYSEQIVNVPSAIVLPHMDELDREEFLNWGLLPIEATAEQFLATVAQYIDPFQREVESIVHVVEPSPYQEIRRFREQFVQLSLEASAYRTPRNDFHLGFDPEWPDILNGKDAEFEVVDLLIDKIAANNSQPAFYVVLGPAFTGKSTAILRVARKLISEGYTVFQFRSEVKLDVDAAVYFVSRWERSVLLFDGIADFSDGVGELLGKLDSHGVPVVILSAERHSRREKLYSSIDSKYWALPHGFDLKDLTNTDIARLIGKLTEVGRLGKISNLSVDEQTRYFIHNGSRRLFGSLSGLEAGRGFLRRLEDEYGSLDSDTWRNVFIIAAMVYSTGYPIPSVILAGASGVSIRDLILALSDQGPLADLLQLNEYGNVKPWHRLAASAANRVLPVQTETVQSLLQSLAQELAPYNSAGAITQQTLPYRITRQLLSHDVLARWLRRTDIEAFYGKIESLYGWNARYWEQRALAEVEIGHFDTAESYAENAVKILPNNAYSRNTLGTILLRKGLEWTTPGSEAAKQFYQRGVLELLRAIEISHDGELHPFTTFFNYTRRFLDHLYSEGPVEQSFREQWNYWYDRAKNARIFMHPELSEQLERFHWDWMLANVPD